MGMDIYLENPEIKAMRKKYKRNFRKYVKLRDAAKYNKDEEEEKRYQEKVEKWYNKMYNGKMGYFRVSYNDYSISWWLMYNIDEEAKADWGIEPFYSASRDKKDHMIKDTSFHRELLDTAKRWYEKALKLKGKESFLMVTEYKKSSFEKNRLVKKKVVLKPKETDSYIKWLKELVDFAELAVRTKSPISVC